MSNIKSFRVLSRGRKYFECQLGNAKAKLVINAISESVQPGETVSFVINDLSTHSPYGTTLKFEPVALADSATVAAMQRAASAEKWLGYAEADAKTGLRSSNAISEALRLCAGLPPFADRLAALREAVKRNTEAHEAKEREWAREAEAQRQAAAEYRAAERQKQAERRQSRALFPLSDLPPFNKPVRWYGQVVVFESSGKSFRISEDHPSVEGSHLLGHEGDLGCYCYYREATADEIAALDARDAERAAAAEARKHREAEIRRIAEYIKSAGERPDGWNEPSGERLIDSQTIYGGGEWFVVGEDAIWYVQNNGADGDYWGANNVRTGGAGAIGWRIPFDQQIADELRGLEAAA